MALLFLYLKLLQNDRMKDISSKDRFINRVARHLPLIIDWLKWKSGRNEKWVIRRNILGYYKSLDSYPEELFSPLKYIRKNGLKALPYNFIEKYKPEKIEVYTDHDCGLRYVVHSGHRLYYPREMGKHLIRHTYAMIQCEQDKESAHCYLSGSFEVSLHSVIVDVGAAEGNFSLSAIEKAERIYIFEMEEQWKEPLEKTFEPWKNKVKVINKYVSDTDSENTIRLDTFLAEEKIGDENIFIKLDVEGAEALVLDGAEKTLAKENVKIAICTYHNQNDHEDLSAKMKNKNYRIETSQGYMLFHYNGLDAPYFRRGLIRCQR